MSSHASKRNCTVGFSLIGVLRMAYDTIDSNRLCRLRWAYTITQLKEIDALKILNDGR